MIRDIGIEKLRLYLKLAEKCEKIYLKKCEEEESASLNDFKEKYNSKWYNFKKIKTLEEAEKAYHESFWSFGNKSRGICDFFINFLNKYSNIINSDMSSDEFISLNEKEYTDINTVAKYAVINKLLKEPA